jgi:hypothetical protein
VLDATRIDVAEGEDALFFRTEVFANDGDDAHIREVAGGEGEMGGGAAEAAIPAAGRSFKCIERDTAYDKNCHGWVDAPVERLVQGLKPRFVLGLFGTTEVVP